MFPFVHPKSVSFQVTFLSTMKPMQLEFVSTNFFGFPIHEENLFYNMDDKMILLIREPATIKIKVRLNRVHYVKFSSNTNVMKIV